MHSVLAWWTGQDRTLLAFKGSHESYLLKVTLTNSATLISDKQTMWKYSMHKILINGVQDTCTFNMKRSYKDSEFDRRSFTWDTHLSKKSLKFTWKRLLRTGTSLQGNILSNIKYINFSSLYSLGQNNSYLIFFRRSDG